MKKSYSMILGFSMLFLTAGSVSAHVVVKPNEVKQSAYQTFTIGVPNEKELPTTSMKLLIPDGMRSVMPNVKQGWKISVVKVGDKVSEIEWTGGTVPVGQRDEFLFSAQAPAEESTVEWKAYQTYQDGTVVAWDGEPKNGPASQTKVVKADAAPAVAEDHMSEIPTTPSRKLDISLPMSLAAVALGSISLGMQLYKKK